jgi:hypothetical protein
MYYKERVNVICLKQFLDLQRCYQNEVQCDKTQTYASPKRSVASYVDPFQRGDAVNTVTEASTLPILFYDNLGKRFTEKENLTS